MEKILERIGITIIRLDLKKDFANIIYDANKPEMTGQEGSWTAFLDRCTHRLNAKDLNILKSQSILQRFHAGERNYTENIACQIENVKEWFVVEVFFEEKNADITAVITLRKNTREHLQNHILQLYVYNRCDYFIYLDAKTNSYVMFSGITDGTPLPPAVCEDYSSEIVKYAKDFVAPEDQEKVIYEMGLNRVQDVLESKEVHAFNCGIIDAERGYTRKRLEYRYYDRNNQMILLSRTDITDIYFEEVEMQKEVREQQKKLKEALKRARTDFLTNVYNRQGLQDAASDLFNNPEEAFAMLMIDLDNFKAVNDVMGHIQGDELLRDVAQGLCSSVRSGDLVGRIGGDEFLVFVKNTKTSEEVQKIAQRVCDKVALLSTNLKVPVSCSIGIVLFPHDGTTYEELFSEADSRVYYAKKSGKNQICMQSKEEQLTAETAKRAVVLPHSVFSWDRLGDITKGREDLGEDVPVQVYRLLEFTMNDILTHEYGKDAADDLFRKAGFKAGTELVSNMLDLNIELNTFVASLKELLLSLKIGILDVEEVNDDASELVLTVAQDLDCSGLEPSNEVVCFYDEGFIAGILQAYTKQSYNVREIDCWSNGANVCRFCCSAEK